MKEVYIHITGGKRVALSEVDNELVENLLVDYLHGSKSIKSLIRLLLDRNRKQEQTIQRQQREIEELKNELKRIKLVYFTGDFHGDIPETVRQELKKLRGENDK